MPLIQKRKKLNDFRFGQETMYSGTDPLKHALAKHADVLVSTVSELGRYYKSLRSDRVYAYHAEKRRPQWIQVNRTQREAKIAKKTISVRGKMKGWRVRLFEFDPSQLKRLVQDKHSFIVEFK